MSHQVLQPPGWPRPRGYANGIAASGRLVFTAGVIGWDAEERLAPGLVAQCEQAFANIRAILSEAGAAPEHLVRMTWYVTSREAYLANTAQIGAAWRACFGRVYPVMAVVAVSALMEADAMVELEATAIIPVD